MFEIMQLTAISIFIFSYSLILSGKVNKTLAAVIGAVLVVATGVVPSDIVLSFINWESLGLLAGMFIIVTALKLAGFFRWVGLHIAKTVDHHPVLMFFTLPLITGGLSSFLDAVTVILVMATMTIEILDGLEINPTPFIMAEIFAANIGGSATMMSDPTNVVIGTSLGYSLTDFLANTGPISYSVLVLILAALGVINRGYLKEGLMKHPIHKYRLTHKPKDAILDWRLLKVSVLAFFLAVTLLAIQEIVGISAAMAAIFAATLILAFDLRGSFGIIKKVDWSILLFFGGLFVVVGGLKNTGVLNLVATAISSVTGENLVIAITVVFLLAAVLSIFVDNVALATAFIPVIQGIAVYDGLELAPLAWALSLGVCFGGVATPFGTATNIAGLSICNRMNHPICWKSYFRTTAPLTLMVLLLADTFLILRYAL
ncbi:MAG: SLC13 family permease [Candidatus Bathyarchaeia archaeon]